MNFIYNIVRKSTELELGDLEGEVVNRFGFFCYCLGGASVVVIAIFFKLI